MSELPLGNSGRTLSAGSRVGRYRVIRRLGVGGMAEVYLAVVRGPRGFEKRVALKVLHPHAANDADRVAELFREARIVATLDHPNIAQVLDVGADDGESYLALEYIRGRDVRDLLAAQGRGNPVPLDCALQIVIEAARGLHHAHELRDADGRPLRLVHRDVSPSNVLVSYEGAVKVVDFGLVKVDTSSVATHSGVLKGKFGYMAPEQARGASVDRRCDVYALGVLLYELTLGRRAFTGMNVFEMMNRVFEGAVVAPSEVDPAYPAPLEQIVRKAMSVEPDERFETADALQRALVRFAQQAEVFPSASTLAALMAQSFDEASRSEPSTSALIDAEPTSAGAPSDILAADPPTARGRLRMWSVAAGVGLAAGLGGWWIGGGSQPRSPSTDDATKTEARVEVSAPIADTDGTDPDRSGEQASTGTTLEASPEPPDIDHTVPTPNAEPKNANRRRQRRTKPAKPRSSRPSRPEPSPEPESPLDAMYPPTLR